MIAIVGMGCRFPGGADDPRSFWELLAQGRDAVTRTPPDRWDNEDPALAASAASSDRTFGGFLSRVDLFDAGFFGISPKEATSMDPQQRLCLEVAWEALEDAGLIPSQLAGSLCGVYVGISSSDYGRLQAASGENRGYSMTGSARSLAANRLSYFLDLRGPSVAVDTACSSALVCVHLACRAIAAGDATLAIAGGVNLMISPAITVGMSNLGALSPDGRCKAFDARANGYVRGEGAGFVVLKPLAEAVKDGDRIYAVIRGSAMNQDGRTNGITAPSQWAQEAVLKAAYRDAGVAPREAHYLEAHGTGTLLGDPIEAKALGAVLGEGRAPTAPLRLGSVKTNLGHLESAAGAAGLIKLALALHHRHLPPSLHFQTPNPHIPFDELALRVQDRAEPWPEDGRAPLGGLSSFGFGGTNAHAVLEAAPSQPARAAQPPGPRLYAVSGKTAAALAGAVAAHAAALAQSGEDPRWEDLSHSATVRRQHHDHRVALLAPSAAEAAQALRAHAQGAAVPGLFTGRKPPGRPRKVAFVFSGHGSQWAGMASALLSEDPAAREAFDRADAALRPHLGRPVAEICGSAALLEDVALVQPALFALQLALAARWQAKGLTPAAVLGHSMGEVAAAVVAGALGLADAARVISLRSALIGRTRGQGAMLSAELTLEEAQALAAAHPGVEVAVRNAPRANVFAGPPAAIAAISEALKARGVFCRAVNADVAFHSPQMDPLCAALEEGLSGISPRAPALPFHSSALGGPLPADAPLDARYWVKNLRQPVEFSTAASALLRGGIELFVEFSPHPVLVPALQQLLEGRQGLAVGSARRGTDAAQTLLSAAAALHAAGAAVDLRALAPPGGRVVPLPAYPWQRERHWFTSRGAPAQAPAAAAPVAAPAEVPSSALRALREAPPADRLPQLAAYLRECVALALGTRAEAVEPTQPLAGLGLDSLMAVQIQARVERELGLRLGVAQLLESGGVAALAEGAAAAWRLAAAPGRQTPSGAITAVELSRGAPGRPPLLCIHPGALEPRCWEPLARALGDAQPVSVLCLPTPSGEQAPPTLEALAAACAQAVLSRLPEGPCAIAGWSFGAAVAYQTASALNAAGRRVPLIALLDPVELGRPPRPANPDEDEPRALAWLLRMLAARAGEQATVTTRELERLAPEARLALALSSKLLPGASRPEELQPVLAAFRRGLELNLARVRQWRPAPLPARLLLFHAAARFDGVPGDPALGWGAAGAPELHEVPGDHYTLFSPRAVPRLARVLLTALQSLPEVSR